MASELERRLRKLEAATAPPQADAGLSFVLCSVVATARTADGEATARGVVAWSRITPTGLKPLPPDGRTHAAGLPIVPASAEVPGPVIFTEARSAEPEPAVFVHGPAQDRPQPPNAPQPTQPLLGPEQPGGTMWQPWREPVRELTPTEQRRQHFIERAQVRLPRGYSR